MEKERIRRRHLPHWDVPGAVYFITDCLAGSLPARGLLDIAEYEKELQQRSKPPSMTQVAWIAHKRKLLFVRQDNWLDHQPANRVLQTPALARIVMDAMFHFAGERYDLLSFVVMPSHYHWLFRPRPEWVKTIDTTIRSARERIMYSLKRYTANRCNASFEGGALCGNGNRMITGCEIAMNWSGLFITLRRTRSKPGWQGLRRTGSSAQPRSANERDWNWEFR